METAEHVHFLMMPSTASVKYALVIFFVHHSFQFSRVPTSIPLAIEGLCSQALRHHSSYPLNLLYDSKAD